MGNKKSIPKNAKTKESNKRKKSPRGKLPFDLDSYPWWTRLFIKIFISHENKIVDKLLDIGCLLIFIMLMGIIIYIAAWFFNFLEKVIY